MSFLPEMWKMPGAAFLIILIITAFGLIFNPETTDAVFTPATIGIEYYSMSIFGLEQVSLSSASLSKSTSLFIGFIGLKNGGIIVANGATFLSLGDFTNPSTLLAGLGFLLISILSIRKIAGAIIIGILTVTLISIFLNLVEFNGVFALPPDVTPILMELDILGALDVAMISVIMSFLFVNLFDTAGTLFGVATRANLIEESGDIKDLDMALKVDSSSSIFGSFLGCAPVTSYVESSAGIEAGGRTGLTAVVVGLLFLFSTFLSPLAAAVPAYATAGALIYVAILMLSGMESLNWDDQSELLPALIMVVMIPLTFSIANGIALGFLAYVSIKVFVGEIRKISSGAWFLTLIFVAKFIFL